MSISKCRAIVLGTVNYSESSVVLKCYTDLHGLQSYMVNGVRSKKGSIKPSQLQPLSLLELEADHRQDKNLQRIRELKCTPVMHALHFDVVKSAIGIFMAELISKCIRGENQADEQLFSFLFHAIQILDLQKESAANFPVYFLTHLTRYLGFFPKGEFGEESGGFDIREGIFHPFDARNPWQMPQTVSRDFSLFLHASFDASHEIPMNAAKRNDLLEWLVSYYKEHVPNFIGLKSNKVLSEALS